MTFASLVGNRAVVSRLKRMAQSDSIPPSLLFTGPPGVGKLAAALTLAKAQNCATLRGDACDACPVCARIDRGEHPDVTILRPEGPGRQLKAEAVRKIVSEIPFRPFEGRRRVAIFVDAERMNPTAANTLLKTLEEPPPWATLVLVTANAAALLPTILSRCQIYRFAPLAIEDVTEQLVQGHGMDGEEARVLAAVSGGSLTKALELADESLADVRQSAFRLASVVVDGGREQELVPWADQLSKDGRLLLVLQVLIGILRDVAMTLAGGVPAHRDLEGDLEKLATGAPLPAWIYAHYVAEEALLDLKDRYLNKRITVSRLLSELSTARRRAPKGFATAPSSRGSW